MTVAVDVPTVLHGDCKKILDTLRPDAIVTDPPEDVQRKYGLIERLRERAGGHLGYIGRADTLMHDMSGFIVPPERMMIWFPPNGRALHSRKGVEWTWYPVYLWGISGSHDGPLGDMWGVPYHPATDHPGEKPVKVMEAIIRLVCPPDGLVVDPYCGSGTTLLAAKACGRRAVGIDNDERWVELAKERVA